MNIKIKKIKIEDVHKKSKRIELLECMNINEILNMKYNIDF